MTLVRRIRITTLALACGLAGLTGLIGMTAAVAAALAGCGASQAEVRTAHDSGYDTDFANVYRAALAAVRKSYPHLTEDARAGVIKTAWHPVRVSSDPSGPPSTQQSDQSISNPFSTTRVGRKQYFIRFNVYVVGGNPWRVRVVGQASEWDAGGVPAELQGANEPHWLKGRADALRVAIHERLDEHAVALPSTARAEAAAPAGDAAEPRAIDTSALGDIPAEAATVVAAVLRAARARDFAALGATMRPAFTWSLGAPPSAEQALVLWRADASLLAQLVAVIEAGCATAEGGRRVLCPGPAVDPGYAGYRAAFEPGPDGAWQMVLFVSGT